MRRAFDLVDVDGGGTLESDEVLMLADKLSDALPQEVLETAWADMAKNDDGEVSFDTFAGWWEGKADHERKRQQVRNVFDRLDDDGSGARAHNMDYLRTRWP